MPLLTTDLWFHDWYFNILPETTREKAQQHIKEVFQDIQNLYLDPETAQYYIPMGYKMSCLMMGTLPALTYMTELRSTTYVHATLRKIAIEMWESLESFGIKMFLDKNDEMLDLRRGKQDIQIKQ